MNSRQPDIQALYQTTSGNEYPLDFFIVRVLAKNLSYQPDIVRRACQDGCSNYNYGGGCPPRAPLLMDLIGLKDEVYLIACRFWSKYKPQRVAQSKNSAIHWKFQDGILARVLNQLGHDLSHTVGEFFLSTGYCMGCPGKKCNFKLGFNYCRNPKKRTYSLEATGINVVETVQVCLNLSMYWYSPGKIDVPYMLKCIAFFPKVDHSEDNRRKFIYDALKSNPRLSPLNL